MRTPGSTLHGTRTKVDGVPFDPDRTLGRIVPDVIANLGGRQIYTQGGTLTKVDDDFDEYAEDTYSLAWPLTLLIEVTVTHHIDEEKLRRIRELYIPTLEIDLLLEA